MLPSALAAVFDSPNLLPSVTREVQTFGNHQVTLRGPLTLELQLCGFRTRHPFYFIDGRCYSSDRWVRFDAGDQVSGSVHSSVAMTEPHHAHRVVVTSRSTALGASETAGVPTSRKWRLTASGDSLTPLSGSTELITVIDIDQPDAERAHVTKIEDGEVIAASVMKINQCYQGDVDVFRSRSAYCMLSDTEYSDFDEFDGDEEWENCQQDYLDYVQLQEEEAALADVYIAIDEKELDAEGPEVEVLLPRHSVDVFRFKADVADEVPILPPPLPFRDMPTELNESSSPDFTRFALEEVASIWSAMIKMQEKVCADYQFHHTFQLQQEQSESSEAKSISLVSAQFSPA